MKNTFFFLMILGVACSSQAQTSHLDRFYNKFTSSGKEDGVGVISASFLVKTWFSNDGSNKGLINKISNLRLLILDKNKTPSAPQQWTELGSTLREDRFEDLFSIRQGNDQVRLLSKDEKDGNKEIVVLLSEKEGDGMLLSFLGRFTAADLDKMVSAFQKKDSQ